MNRIRQPQMPTRRCIYFALIGLLVAFLGSPTPADDTSPYQIVDNKVDRSTYLGWRAFHSACHGCHGVDAIGTTVAPDLVARVRGLTSRDFSNKVLTRYRITIVGSAADADDRTAMREGILEEVMRRERGDLIMPAWEVDPNIKPHVLDIYAYLRARADGALGPGRPEQQAE